MLLDKVRRSQLGDLQAGSNYLHSPEFAVFGSVWGFVGLIWVCVLYPGLLGGLLRFRHGVGSLNLILGLMERVIFRVWDLRESVLLLSSII